MEDPKKRLFRSEDEHTRSRRNLERQIMNVASNLAGSSAGEEEPVPCWIEPLQLIRIVAPFVSMN